MKKQYVYSPLPADAYLLQGTSCDVGELLKHPAATALWNFYWLSAPDIDVVPSLGERWSRGYMPQLGRARAVMIDVLDDEVLYRKVTMHPDAFIDFFEHDDVSIYECYEKLGGEHWVETVLRRADEASLREVAKHPLVTVQGNLLSVDFRRAA